MSSAGAAERLIRGAANDAHLAFNGVDHIDEFLLLVGREYEIVDRAGAARRLLVRTLNNALKAAFVFRCSRKLPLLILDLGAPSIEAAISWRRIGLSNPTILEYARQKQLEHRASHI
jgi:hypothetical protein